MLGLKVRIKGFIWDRFNIEKCQKHGAVFTLRVSGKHLKFRVISARYAREKEIKGLHKYEEEKSKIKDNKKD